MSLLCVVLGALFFLFWSLFFAFLAYRFISTSSQTGGFFLFGGALFLKAIPMLFLFLVARFFFPFIYSFVLGFFLGLGIFVGFCCNWARSDVKR